jgi:hypothetical protein
VSDNCFVAAPYRACALRAPLLYHRAVQIAIRAAAEMQAGIGRTGFDVSQVVFDDEGYGKQQRKVVSSYRLFIPNGSDNRWLEKPRLR